MKNLHVKKLLAIGILLTPLIPSVARADSKGQLVYAFTYSSNQSVTARDSATPAESVDSMSGSLSGGSSASSHYSGSLKDKGTMTVEVVGKERDGGLVVNISEQGQDVHRAPPATCVVYGNTNIICDPNKTVYTEEYTLLRFLGANFVDPSQLDAKRHWLITQDSGGMSVKADYTINSNTNGMMQIGETRSVREAHTGSLTTDIQTKIGYDFNRAVPTTVDEYVTQRHDSGSVGDSTTIYQTTLNLLSDSMAKT